MFRMFKALFAGLLLVLSAAGAAWAEQRVALVIGNSGYKFTQALGNPRNDAQDIAAALTKLGFNVLSGDDLDKAGMDSIIGRFARAATGADAALVFYAGHALQYRGGNYVMPVDAKLEDDVSVTFEMTRVDDMLSALNRASGVKMLILDACRNNPLAEKMLARGASRGGEVSRGLQAIQHNQGVLVAYSTQANQVAADGAGRNSPFTEALLKELPTPNLEVGALFRRVAATVYGQTHGQQLPELSISILGEFFFARAASDADVWGKIRDSLKRSDFLEFSQTYPDSAFVELARSRMALIDRFEAERRVDLAPPPTVPASQKVPGDKATRSDGATAPVQPAQALVQPAQALVQPAQALVQPAQAPVQSTQAPVQPAQAPVQPSQALQPIQAALLPQPTQPIQAVKPEADKAPKTVVVGKDTMAVLVPQPPVGALLDPDAPRNLTVVPGAGISRPPDVAVVPPLASAAADIKRELTRLGCYASTIDAQWPSPKTARALQAFALARKPGTMPSEPGTELLALLREAPAGTCGIACGGRPIAADGACTRQAQPTRPAIAVARPVYEPPKYEPPKPARIVPKKIYVYVPPPRRIYVPQPRRPVEVARPRRQPPSPRPAPAAARPGGCFNFNGQSFC